MSSKFYDGHSMEWIERFKKATPANLRIPNAICLAILIQHLVTIKRRNTIKLTRENLNEFGLNFRRIKPYLQAFEKAGLIELQIKNRSMTQVKLVLLDPYHYVPKYKTKVQKEGTNKGTKATVPEREQHCTRTGTATVPEREQLKKNAEGNVGRIDSEGRVGRVGREDRKVGRVGREDRKVGRVGRIAGRVG